MSGKYGTGKHGVGDRNPDQITHKDNANNGGIPYKTGGTKSNNQPLTGGTVKPKGSKEG